MSDENPTNQASDDEPTAAANETTDDATGQADTGQQTGGEGQQTSPTFTQDQVDLIVKERLDRERAKAEKAAEKAAAEAERKAAEEQGEYKKLYEKLQGQLTEAEQKAAELEAARLRETVARKHNLPDALAERLRGETEEDLEADAKTLLEAMPKPAAPNTTTDATNGVGNASPAQTMSEAEVQELAAVYGVSVDGLKKSLGIP